MLIDWFTVAAQAVNFAILVWLLTRLLYRPVLAAIDARERQLSKVIADADAGQAEVQRDRELLRQQLAHADQQRAELLAQASREALAERQRLLEEARTAAGELAASSRQALLEESRNLHTSITHQMQQEIFATARKVLGDLASVSLEAQLVAAFLGHLRQLDEPTRTGLRAAFHLSPPAIVRSAFELSAAQRASIQNALDGLLQAPVPLRFETVPDLIGGLELVGGGNKLAWSISDYLGELQRGVDALLKPTADRADAASGVQADG